jgi:DNA-binding XRE family transcriptional regulator
LPVDQSSVDLSTEIAHAAMHMSNPSSKHLARTLFSQNLRATRLKKEISQEQLAELAGFHRTYVSQVERCVTNVSLDNAERLAVALNTELWEMLRP